MSVYALKQPQSYPTWLIALVIALAMHVALLAAKQIKLGEAEGVNSPTFQIALSLMSKASPQPLSAESAPQQQVQEIKTEPTPILKEKVAEIKPPEPKKAQKPTPQVMEAKAVSKTPQQLNSIAPAAKSISHASKGIEADYRSRLIEIVKAAKQYPYKALDKGQQGTVFITFTVSKSGKLLNSSITEKSKYRLLNKESMHMLKRASPFPPAPKGFNSSQITISIPVEFRVSG